MVWTLIKLQEMNILYILKYILACACNTDPVLVSMQIHCTIGKFCKCNLFHHTHHLKKDKSNSKVVFCQSLETITFLV